MCGRYALNATPVELRNHFGRWVPEHGWPSLSPLASFNIAPSRDCVVLRHSKRDGDNVVDGLKWGFRPRRAKRSWINARAETLFETRAFSESARRRRCLVVASGWYEWQEKRDRLKQPYYVHFEGLFAFAGVWTARKLDADEWELSFAIVTTPARGVVKPIHERMPLVLPPRHYAAWLDPGTENARGLLVPFDDGRMQAYPVSTYVNDPRHDDAKCLEPLEA